MLSFSLRRWCRKLGDETRNLSNRLPRWTGPRVAKARQCMRPTFEVLEVRTLLAAVIVPAGATITAESFSPADGAINPGETVTVSFGLQNAGDTNTTNLVASLQATGGVTSPSGPQNYGVLVNGGPAVTRLFTFTADPGLLDGQTLTATLALQDGATNQGTVGFDFTIAARAAPTITSITPPANGVYGAGQNLDFLLTWDQAVFLNIGSGTPRFPVTVGSTTRQAFYISGSGSNVLTFRISVLPGEADSDGIESFSPIFVPAGSSMKNSAGTDAVLTFTPPNTSGVVVNTSIPLVSSIVRASSNPTSALSVNFTVTFNKIVTGVDPSDFVVATGGGLSGGSVISSTGNGSTYTVTVSGYSGSGTIGLNLVDDDSILNSLLEPLAGSGAGNGNFTGQVYTISSAAIPANLVVDLATDELDGNYSTGDLSLREAVVLANAAADANMITFASALAGQTLTATLNDTNVSFGPTAFVISSDVTIQGPTTAPGVTIDGGGTHRLFGVLTGASLTLQNLTLTGGKAQGGNGGDNELGGGGGGAAGLGGAIFNQGTLVLQESLLTENQAVGGNGGSLTAAVSGLGGGGGGGLATDGNIPTGNNGGAGGDPNGGSGGVLGVNNGDGGPGQIGGGGGGGAATTGTSGSGGAGGFGGGGGGGGDRDSGGGTGGDGGFGGGAGGGSVSGNSGFGGGNGLNGSSGSAGGGGAGLGGAIFNNGGNVTITNSTLTANSAQGGFGGAGVTIISAASGRGLGGAVFNRNGAVTIRNSTLADNSVVGADLSSGGSFFNLADTVGQTATAVFSNSIFANSTGGSDVVNQQLAGTATIDASAPNIIMGSVGTPVETLTLNNPTAVPAPVQNAPTLAAGGTLQIALPQFYVITATGPSGESSASNQQTITPNAGNQSVNLSWTQVPGATGYNVYRSTVTGNYINKFLIARVGGSNVFYTDTGSPTGAGTPPNVTTFKLTFNGEETGDITYTGTAADATEVQDELNALATISAVGGVTVTQSNTATTETFTIVFTNSLVAANAALQVTGAVTSGAGSFGSPSTTIGITGTPITADPQLGALANNGGLTQTMAITIASPAYNAGGNGYVLNIGTDQRGSGFARVTRNFVDLGAFEFQETTPPTATLNSAPNVLATAAATNTTTVTITYADSGIGVEPVTFDASNITVDNGATVTGVSAVGNVVTYTITAPAATWEESTQGTYIIGLVGDPGGVRDLDGNFIDAVAAFGSFTVDTIPLTATINQPSGQVDPTNASPVNFRVVFNKPVSDFGTGDVTLSGTAGATTAIVSPIDSLRWNIAISGMTQSGTVIATISAGVATDTAGNPNLAATVLDNTVLFDQTSPTATLTTAPPPIFTASAGTNTTTLTITYGDTNSGIDVSTFATTNIAVNNGATVTGVSAVGNVVTYTITAPAATWLASAQGTYTVSLVGGTGGVKDLAGNSVVANASFGSFLVDTPTVSLSVNSETIAEGSGATTVTATLSAPSSLDVTVNLSFAGSAANETDYTRSGTQIVIPSGSTTGSITLTAVQDARDEDDENIVVEIASVTNATESGTQLATATITDDDLPPVVTIADGTKQEGNSGTTTITFEVTLSAASGKTVTVNVATEDGTAVAQSDYLPFTSPSVTFAPGETFTVVLVTVRGDTLDENDETFAFNLTAATNATIGDAHATGTILDDDATVYRLYNPNADLHVFTTSQGEYEGLLGLGYRDETTSGFTVSTQQLAGSLPIHRLYNPFAGHHYLTTSDGDRDFLQSKGWLVEPDQGFLYPAATEGTSEIFHLYNNNTGDHLYTESESERSGILANPTQPPPWSQHTRLGFAFAASATASALPQVAEVRSNRSPNDLPVLTATDNADESDSPSATPPVALDSQGSDEDSVVAAPAMTEDLSRDVATNSVEMEPHPEEDMAALDAIWEEFGSGLLEITADSVV